LNRINNALSNLEYLTRSGNILHRNEFRRKVGLPTYGEQQFGEDNPSAKLTERQVESIRVLGEQGLTHEHIAGIFGVRRETVGKIIRNERWVSEAQAEVVLGYDTRNGYRRGMTGESNPRCKLTKEQVLEIRKLAATGMVHRRIAAQFSVGSMTVSRIVNGQRWGWLKDEK
jgi:plasmid maintenance system antidote protein VapI